MIIIRRQSPYLADVSKLIQELDEFQSKMYPSSDEYHDPIELLDQDNCYFVSASIISHDQNTKQSLCGIGAVKIINTENLDLELELELDTEIVLKTKLNESHQSYGELKRIYVPPEFRGHGIAKKIIQNLEQHLVSQNIFVARLETGIYHLEAISLYQKLGYQKISRFGKYWDNPLSVFMEKNLN